MSSPGSSNNDKAPLETVRLNGRERRSLMRSINATGSSSRFQAERRALRIEFDVPRVLLMVIQPSGSSVRHAAVPRNLSKRGIALVLGRFVYPDTACKVAMPNLAGEWVMLTGEVRMCRHVGGIYHETAIVFEEAIDLRDYVDLTREQEDIVREELSEDLGDSFEEDEANPVIIILDDDKSSRRLLSHWIGKLGLRSREATTPLQASKYMKEIANSALVLDVHLAEGVDGLEFLKASRAKGYRGAVICITSDESEQLRERANQAGVSQFLNKPLSEDQLREALETALALSLDETVSDPLYSTLREDETMAPLLRDYGKSLNGLVAKINEASGASDFEAIERVASQLKGTAASYGFQTLSDQAIEVIKTLHADPIDIASVSSNTSSLVQLLRRVIVD